MTWLSWPFRNVVATKPRRRSLRSAHSLAPVAGYAPTLRSAVDTLVLADYARRTGAAIPADNNGGAIA